MSKLKQVISICLTNVFLGESIGWASSHSEDTQSHFESELKVVYEKSPNAQFMDLTLHDLTDPLGISRLEQFKVVPEKYYLYQFEKGDTVGYILGTLHTFPFHWLSESLLSIVKSCDALIQEHLDPSLEDFKALGAISPESQAPEDWWGYKETPMILKRLLTFYSMMKVPDLFKIEDFTPQGVAMGLYSLTNENGMDKKIGELFPKDKNYGLESLTEGKESINIIDFDLYRENFENGEPLFSMADIAYIQGYAHQSPHLVEYINSTANAPDVIHRNQLWFKRLPGLLEGHKRPLIMVGCGHLMGPDGMINYLQSNGYDLSYLPISISLDPYTEPLNPP